ncbi:hypothetical protein [Streptomyces filamentosus]|uniref:hypothetical protein n=1 Tax=Streptomyces filamentosus TaxID=67294 RepID=UPI0033306CD7
MLDSQYGKTLTQATDAAKKAGFKNVGGHPTNGAGLYDRSGTWVVCEQKPYRWTENSDWSMQFNLVAETGDCPGGIPAPGLKEKYEQLYGAGVVEPSSAPRHGSGDLAPEDDVDGDGWLDDPCPDESAPLWAEC